jgi:hypothetical protein
MPMKKMEKHKLTIGRDVLKKTQNLPKSHKIKKIRLIANVYAHDKIRHNKTNNLE